MTACFERVLETAASGPQQEIERLDLIELEERQSLEQWNDNEWSSPGDTCVYDLFEQQAARTPGATAIIFGKRHLTYAALNQRANQLARHLHLHGVGPEVVVGLILERSLEFPVALLAILKAGGAYLPLDPAYPRERLSYILEDSCVRVLVTKTGLLELLPKHSANVICLDADCHRIESYSTTNMPPVAALKDLVYTIYTSGSTGRPKGVQIEHCALSHYVVALNSVMPQTFSRRYLHTASFAFSSSVRQMFVPLCYGGTVVLVPPEIIKSPAELFDYIVRSDAEVIDIVPTMWRTLIRHLENEGATTRAKVRNSNLATILLASEPLTVDLVRRWRSLIGSKTILMNLYGQTETTGIVAIHRISQKDTEVNGLIPIGQPIANTTIYILDQHLQPVTVGIPGEMYIGGLGLARGYLNRNELTSQRFVPNPFELAGGRLYRTGDRAHYLPDGHIAFLGRSDHQVKIRGFRVELGEVEAVLREHSSVREAVVTARDDNYGDLRLIAYVVHSQASLNTSGLRDYLKEKLPYYMIPAAIVVLESLPLTPNGKLDRKALPPPQLTDSNTLWRAPQTPQEEILCGLFADVLGVGRVGLDDSFFDLGGHSLMATLLVNRVRDTFGVELGIGTLFEAPSVGELVRRLWEGGDDIA